MTTTRELLLAERASAQRVAAALDREFADIAEAASGPGTDDEHDPEGATLAFERQHTAALLAQARNQIADIDAAIGRLDDGTYGVCVRCGQPVGKDRLAARPAAAMCVRCAARLPSPDVAMSRLRSPLTRHILNVTGLMRGSDMTVWYRTRTTGWSARVAIAAALLATVLVAMIPVALFAGLIIMMLGHVVAGLALFGASILAAGVAVVIAGFSGVQHVRKLINQQRQRVVQLRQGDYHFD